MPRRKAQPLWRPPVTRYGQERLAQRRVVGRCRRSADLGSRRSAMTAFTDSDVLTNQNRRSPNPTSNRAQAPRYVFGDDAGLEEVGELGSVLRGRPYGQCSVSEIAHQVRRPGENSIHHCFHFVVRDRREFNIVVTECHRAGIEHSQFFRRIGCDDVVGNQQAPQLIQIVDAANRYAMRRQRSFQGFLGGLLRMEANDR